MTHLNSTLRSKAMGLLRVLEANPNLLSQIRVPREIVELKVRPKAGQKIHGNKPAFRRPIDFEAVDLKTDLDRALETDDFELMAISYYSLAYIIGVIRR